jgi:hypothetical protein
VGPRVDMDIFEKTKTSCPYQKLKCDSSVVIPVYNNYAIPAPS